MPIGPPIWITALDGRRQGRVARVPSAEQTTTTMYVPIGEHDFPWTTLGILVCLLVLIGIVALFLWDIGTAKQYRS
jgi:hypothetical protein